METNLEKHDFAVFSFVGYPVSIEIETEVGNKVPGSWYKFSGFVAAKKKKKRPDLVNSYSTSV